MCGANSAASAGTSLSARAPSEPVQKVRPLAGLDDHVDHGAQVLAGRDHPGQAEQREWRIVRVDRQPRARLLGHRHDRAQEGRVIGPQVGLGHAIIERQAPLEPGLGR